jgi:cell wall-associated NlpC family hydrolase
MMVRPSTTLRSAQDEEGVINAPHPERSAEGAQSNGRTFIDERAERAAVVVEALTWLGTAFHHMGRIKIKRDSQGRVIDRGGADCAYATMMIYHAALPARVPAMEFGYYAAAWNLSRKSAAAETYLATVLGLEHVRETDTPLPGDLVLYRWGLAWAHGAIVMSPGWPAIAHASWEAKMFTRDLGDQGRLARRQKRFFSFWTLPAGERPFGEAALHLPAGSAAERGLA